MNTRLLIRLAISAGAIALIGIHTWKPTVLPADRVSIALLIVAVLPWMQSFLDTAEFPGGWKLQFHQLKEQVAEQQSVINDLVKYSMSASIFDHLCGIALLREYKYVDGEANRREMYFLRDSGLIRPTGQGFLDFNAGCNGMNLVDVAEPTPIGRYCIRIRRSEIPSNMLLDRANLRVDPATL
jgi:hypothetical protein